MFPAILAVSSLMLGLDEIVNQVSVCCIETAGGYGMKISEIDSMHSSLALT